MNRFDSIYELSSRQKGGADGLQKLLPEVPEPKAIAALVQAITSCALQGAASV